MTADTWAKRKQEIVDYFDCSWSKARQICHGINDVSIFYYTVANKPRLNLTAYEKKYGRPKSCLPR